MMEGTSWNLMFTLLASVNALSGEYRQSYALETFRLFP